MLVRLEWTPVHFRNLSRLYTPGRVNGSLAAWRPGGKLYDETGAEVAVVRKGGGLEEVQHALSTAHADLTTWARALADDRPQLAETIDDLGQYDEPAFVTAFCALLDAHASTLLTLPWCHDLLGGLVRMERRLSRLTDEWVPGWYAGRCERCETPCHVEPGVTWVTCSGCGVTTPASDHIAVVLAEAADWTARPKGTPKKPGLAEAIVALTSESSAERVADRIMKWNQRGRLIACYDVDRDGDPRFKRYRLGSVLTLLGVAS